MDLYGILWWVETPSDTYSTHSADLHLTGLHKCISGVPKVSSSVFVVSM